MFRVCKVLRVCNGNTLIALCLLAVLVGVVHFITRSIEFNYSSQNNCTYYEPIDIVYTWVNGSDPLFIEEMNKYLKLGTERVDSARHRYEDKHELRFSLRSIEKYIPWFNHVYLVTNGQIPYWLNLDYEKITVITHHDIFRDKNHLPTFSSPAIESNLHRIPGLTKRFIYFNDDVFVGQPIYLDDFYTVNKGYSIFLDYVLPSCASNCPWVYVGDGQCDVGCNNVACQFDGGDCNVNENGRNAEKVYSQEASESHNSKVNKELDTLRDKVESLFKSDSQKRFPNTTNTSSIQIYGLYNNSSVKNKLNRSLYMTYEGKSVQHFNMSISKLVEEHNKKVIVRNRKKNRKKRSSLKGADSVSRLIHKSSKHIDGYLESLLYTQRLFNKKYGFKSRYVPAHAPFFLDKDILQRLEYTFLTEFEITERNRFRHKDDLQFGFSYYYFLMSETTKRSVDLIFDEFDTDNSGTWSDREIRNILTRIYELPLSYGIVDHFEDILLNCSELRKYPEVNTPPYERYIDSRLPTISKEIVIHCPFLSEFLKGRFGHIPKYKFHIVNKDAEHNYATFRMLVSNITNVVIKLDEIRSKVTKFVCLNDNLDESKSRENELVRAILYDFYLSLFPHPSKFELPEHSRNRFLHMSDLLDWRRRHFVTKMVLCLAIMSLIFITFFNVLKKGCCKIFNKLFC